MNSNPKNNLDYSEQQLEPFSDNTILELSPQKTDSAGNTKYVLIKHDYYSSDSDNGRDLLSGFFSVLSDSSYSSIIVYLIDKGVLLLDKNNPLYNDMLSFLDRTDSVIADNDSIGYYGITDYRNSKIVLQSAHSIAEDLIYISDILILE